jgi:hypothetical protein
MGNACCKDPRWSDDESIADASWCASASNRGKMHQVRSVFSQQTRVALTLQLLEVNERDEDSNQQGKRGFPI